MVFSLFPGRNAPSLIEGATTIVMVGEVGSFPLTLGDIRVLLFTHLFLITNLVFFLVTASESLDRHILAMEVAFPTLRSLVVLWWLEVSVALLLASPSLVLHG